MAKTIARTLYSGEWGDISNNSAFAGNYFIFVDLSNVHPDERNQWHLKRPLVNNRVVIPTCEFDLARIGDLHFPSVKTDRRWFSTITSDRMLYRQFKDSVHLLLISSDLRNETASVEIKREGRPFATRQTQTNELGVAEIVIKDLPAGNFEAIFDDDSSCMFTVAEFKLAALDAELVNFEIEPSSPESNRGSTTVNLKLSTFGTPLNGKVKCDLLDDGQSIFKVAVPCDDGRLTVKFPGIGSGNLTVNLQSTDDASRTATVVLQGTSKAQRDETVFSRLGPIIKGSLVPRPHSWCIRGLHFTQDGMESAPIRLHQAPDGTATLEAVTGIDNFCLQIKKVTASDCEDTSVIERECLHPGEKLPLDIAGAVHFLACGGFVNGKPWEGTSCIVTPSELKPKIVVPEKIEPSQTLPIKIESKGGQLAYLIVRDARLPAASSPRTELADSIQDYVKRQLFAGDLVAPLNIAKTNNSWDFLLMEGNVRLNQIREAQALSRDTKKYSPLEALVAMGYATEQEAQKSLARHLGVRYLDLRMVNIREDVIELMPESVARENAVLPICEFNNSLTVVMADPSDIDTMEKLRFILNRNINALIAERSQIIDCINLYYGQVEGESADSILQEFTDTSIDFTSTLSDVENEFSLTDSERTFSIEQISNDPGSIQSTPTRSTASKPSPESDEPGDVLFAGLIQLENGCGTIAIDLGPEVAQYSAEVLVMSDEHDFDWADASTLFSTEKESWIQFDLPKFVHERDSAEGRIYFHTKSGQARIRLTHPDGRTEAVDFDLTTQPGRMAFQAVHGEYAASIEDIETGAVSKILAWVEQPGNLRTIVRPIKILEPGQTVSRSLDPTIHSIRPLPSIDHSLQRMITATVNYQHLCCEQTAAKVRSAVMMYVTCSQSETSRRAAATASIIAGVKRMKSMWLKGRGFMSYPESNNRPNVQWGRLAACHLKFCNWLLESKVGAGLEAAAKDAVDMANDVAGFSIPIHKQSLVNGYLSFKFNKSKADRASALEFALKQASEASLSNEKSSVALREKYSYLAAILIGSDESAHINLGLLLATKVFAEIKGNGRLYSTTDSIAAVTMLYELAKAGILKQNSVQVNGQTMTVEESTTVDDIESVTACKQKTLVELSRVEQTSWESFENTVRTRVSLTSAADDSSRTRFGLAETIHLKVTLVRGYKFGDLLHVCLPDSLSRLEGGGQIKQFSVDFAGRDSVSIPLVVTGPSFCADGSTGPHHFAVCVRNMYEEDRIGNPGLMSITIDPTPENREPVALEASNR